MEDVLKKARDQGIVVVTHEASSMENCDYDLEAFNYDEYGVHHEHTRRSNGRRRQIYLHGRLLTNDSHNMEADGAIAAQEKDYPNMELIDERIVTDDNAETAYQKAKRSSQKVS